MNTKNWAVSEYDNYDFNSFCEYERERYYGAKSDGIYEIGGPVTEILDDEGVDISAEISKTRIGLGVSNEKKIVETYINLESAGDLLFQVDADSKSQTYLLSNGKPDLHTLYHAPGKGLVGRFLGWTIKNHNGSDLKINEIETLIDVLSRKAHND